MARRFTLQIIMDLASKIGANPGKVMSRSNISFLGKGPTKNPLFQGRLAGLENASVQNLGDPKRLFAEIDDAVGWAKDGKLNVMQTEILGHNLSGINKILNPPVLPSASITPIAPGIEGLKRFPKESHKFMGRPLKDKDFSEIDRMIMEGKIPDARGRTWNLKVPETGPFQGWKPSVVPKANIPASKINHQMIADKYGIDVELIRGKDWVEVLEVIRKLGYAEGGLAEILQAPRSGYKRGRVVSPGGYQGEEEKSEFSIWKPSTWSLGGPESETNPTMFGTQNSLMNKTAIINLEKAIGFYEASGKLDQEQQLDYELKLKQLEALIAGAQGKAKGGLARILEV
mgnify:CR=1 FL=1